MIPRVRSPLCRKPGPHPTPRRAPVRPLRPQVIYHFLQGYTSKMAGTEMGITGPVAAFSSCYGEPFLVWHPTKYATSLLT